MFSNLQHPSCPHPVSCQPLLPPQPPLTFLPSPPPRIPLTAHSAPASTLPPLLHSSSPHASHSPCRLLTASASPIGEREGFFAWYPGPSGSSPSPSLHLLHQHLSHCGLPPAKPVPVARSLCSVSLFLFSTLLLLLFPLLETPHAGAVQIQPTCCRTRKPALHSFARTGPVSPPSLPCHRAFHAYPALVCTLPTP